MYAMKHDTDKDPLNIKVSSKTLNKTCILRTFTIISVGLICHICSQNECQNVVCTCSWSCCQDGKLRKSNSKVII